MFLYSHSVLSPVRCTGTVRVSTESLLPTSFKIASLPAEIILDQGEAWAGAAECGWKQTASCVQSSQVWHLFSLLDCRFLKYFRECFNPPISPFCCCFLSLSFRLLRRKWTKNYIYGQLLCVNLWDKHQEHMAYFYRQHSKIHHDNVV